MKKFIIPIVLLLLKSGCINAQTPPYFKISVNETTHTNYGLLYPVTYEFGFVIKPNKPVAFKWNFVKNEWVKIKEFASGQLTNGKEGVRFDFIANKAYLSVAFDYPTDEIIIRFSDSANQNVPIKFNSTCKYYDNRQAVVTATADDVGDEGPQYSDYLKKICESFRKNNLWLTIGIITSKCDSVCFGIIQSQLNAGNIEIASHSHTHPTIPYANPEVEVVTSKNILLNKLTLPPLFAVNELEFIYTWLEPHGKIEDIVRYYLGKAHYLVDRNGNKFFDTLVGWQADLNKLYRVEYQFFPVNGGWDEKNSIFYPVGFSVEMGNKEYLFSNLQNLNDRFDYVTGLGNVYHLMFHPTLVDWNENGYALEHLKYISNRKNIWYVSFGHLYLYNFTRYNVKVEKVE